MNASSRPGSKGFTMFEIIAVIVVVAVLAAMAVSRTSGTNNDDTLATAHSIESYLRFAQLRAMSDVEKWGIQLNTNTVVLLKDAGTAPINLPGETSPTYTLPDGITISSGTGTIQFDERGRPYSGGGAPSLLLNDYSLTVSGDPSVTITITDNTGFIP